MDERRQLYSGFGDSLVQAFEFAATPFLFGWIGHLLDVRLGTNPWFTTALVLFALVGLGVRAYYGYEAAMRAHEARAPWARAQAPEQGLAGELDGALGDGPVAYEPGRIPPHTQDPPPAAR